MAAIDKAEAALARKIERARKAAKVASDDYERASAADRERTRLLAESERLRVALEAAEPRLNSARRRALVRAGLDRSGWVGRDLRLAEAIAKALDCEALAVGDAVWAGNLDSNRTDEALEQIGATAAETVARADIEYRRLASMVARLRSKDEANRDRLFERPDPARRLLARSNALDKRVRELEAQTATRSRLAETTAALGEADCQRIAAKVAREILRARSNRRRSR